MNAVTVFGANPPDPAAARCPACGAPGKRVRPETLINILNEDKVPVDLEGYSLCLAGECDVVYFGREIFRKGDVKVKVWFKENEQSVPVCYCKNVTAKDIIDHIAVLGCCQNIEDIQRHTGANTGRDCLTKNPAGT